MVFLAENEDPFCFLIFFFQKLHCIFFTCRFETTLSTFLVFLENA